MGNEVAAGYSYQTTRQGRSGVCREEFQWSFHILALGEENRLLQPNIPVCTRECKGVSISVKVATTHTNLVLEHHRKDHWHVAHNSLVESFHLSSCTAHKAETKTQFRY